MKIYTKMYFIVGVFLLAFSWVPFAHAAGFSIGPSDIYNDTYFTGVDGDGADLVFFYAPDDSIIIQAGDDQVFSGYLNGFDTAGFLGNFGGGYGTWHVLYLPPSSVCNGGPYPACLAAMDTYSDQAITIHDSNAPPPPVPTEVNPQQAIPWSLSALALVTVFQAVYFSIFFFAMYMVFAGVAFVYRVIVAGAIR